MNIPHLTSDRLRRLLDERIPPRVLDVRTPAEFEEFHLQGAVNLPHAELEGRAGEIDPMVDVVVVSEHGIRSLRACEWLQSHGYLKVANLIGGVAEFRFHHG
jgi:rhodanese-related sulfurtransferase